MESRKKHVFEVTESETLRRNKSTPGELHRLLVRLLAPVNETLRQKAMYRGDLSTMVAEALDSVDLHSVPLVYMKWGQEDFRGVTIQIPIKTRNRMVAASKKRGVSMNTLINTALVHWLAAEGDVRIKGGGEGKNLSQPA
jgi:hypothetical protein